MNQPKLTVDHVRKLADATDKNWIIVISDNGDCTQFVTWGRSPENKVYASHLSEYVGDVICGGPDVVYESFKLDAAKNKARVEALLPACRKALANAKVIRQVEQMMFGDNRRNETLEEYIAMLERALTVAEK